MKYSLDVEER